MVKHYQQKSKDNNLKEIEQYQDGSWIYLEDPSEQELTDLAAQLNLEVGHLKDALDPNEVPRLEIEDSSFYIFTRAPETSDGRFSTTPLLFLIGENFVLTITQKHLPIFDKFISNQSQLLTTQKIKLFIQLFAEVNNYYNTSLTAINRKIYTSSVKLEKIQNRDIIEFTAYEQTLNEFLNALIRTNAILNNFLPGKIITLSTEDHDLFEDLYLANGQLIELAQTSLQNVKNIRDAYSTILTNDLNRVIKLLTSLTIILTVPTMIASFFGMNVKVPLAEHPWGFVIIAALSISICFGLIYIFTKKNWF